jgi:hypothetical protein
MPNLSSHKMEGLYSLFKGEFGTRKSTAALSYPKPLYYFDYDMKIDAIKLPARTWGLDTSQVDYDTYTNWDKGLEKLNSFRVNCKYKTIVIDSITSLADASIRQTLQFKGTSGGGKKVGTIAVSGFDEYNAEASALNELIAITKDIKDFHKINVILIAHVIQKEIKGPNNTTHMARLLVTAGKVPAQKIPAYCSEIYHFNTENDMDANKPPNYTIRTMHTGDDFARSSLGLPNTIAFNDRPLYENWIKPALDKMNNVESNLVQKL